MAMVTLASRTPVQFVDDVANLLLSTGGSSVTGIWEDADIAVTSAGTPPARALKYTKNDVVELYLTFVGGVWGRPSNASYYNNQGILVFISSSWDSVNHVPSGTTRIMQMPFTGYAASILHTIALDQIMTLQIFYEKDILNIFGSSPVATANYDCVFFFSMEREESKEYDDGQSNFFFFSTDQRSGYYDAGSANAGFGGIPFGWSLPATWNTLRVAGNGIFKYVHPWSSALPTVRLPTNLTSDGYYNFEYASAAEFLNRNCCLAPMRARKSTGDSKVYMAFPLAFNDISMTWNIPIKAFKSWFPVEPGQGIASGDLMTIPLSWNGTSVTWKYMYLNVTSPDGQQLDIAVKHSEV